MLPVKFFPAAYPTPAVTPMSVNAFPGSSNMSPVATLAARAIVPVAAPVRIPPTERAPFLPMLPKVPFTPFGAIAEASPLPILYPPPDAPLVPPPVVPEDVELFPVFPPILSNASLVCILLFQLLLLYFQKLKFLLCYFLFSLCFYLLPLLYPQFVQLLVVVLP